MTAQPRPFGTTSSGDPVQAIHLRGGELTAVILTRGAILQDLRLAGVPRSLTLGTDQLAAYEGRMAYFGAVVGPVANRISAAQASIAGKAYRFPPNEGPNLLHGGAAGTHAKLWQIEDIAADSLTLALTLPGGEGGFPGTRRLQARYALSDSALTLTLSATTDAETLINLAHHGYWNLDGSATTAGHSLRIAADHYLPVDGALLPIGEIRPVQGVFDLRKGRVLDLTEGYDHNFCLSAAPRPLAFAAELTGKSGTRMTIETTAPGLQIYDGRAIATAPAPGHSGQPYGPYAGLAIEPQHWPDAPANPGFPPITLSPGEPYEQTSRFTFTRG